MLPDHLNTQVGESRKCATGTDCYMCVLRGGNYLLNKYTSVINAAVWAVLLPLWSSGAISHEGAEEQNTHPALLEGLDYYGGAQMVVTLESGF